MTKELPKEMLPMFFENKRGKVSLKPMLQAIFEQLYDVGFREFCFIVGRGKRAIEDHFTPDWVFVEYLKGENKDKLVDELQEFYAKIERSTIVFVNQPRPKGFGDAVRRARSFTGSESFLVHAGDDLILSKDNGHVKKLIEAFEELKADAVLLVERVKDPRRYGVVEGVRFSEGVVKVERVVEKPKVPRSDMAIVAMYVFKPKVYQEIDEVEPDKSGEIQLTDAIQSLIDRGGMVYAVELEGKRIDVGTSEAYRNALNSTFKWTRPSF